MENTITLEPGEKLLHSETIDQITTPKGTGLALFFVVGFPFYALYLVCLFGGLLDGHPLPDVLFEQSWTLVVLAILASGCWFLASWLESMSVFRKLLPATEVVVTDSRIFNTGLLATADEDDPEPRVIRFADVVLVEAQRMSGETGALTFTTKSGKQKAFMVRNPDAIMRLLPGALINRAGIDSPGGRREKLKQTITGWLLLIFFTAFFGGFGYLMTAQETCADNLKKGRRAAHAGNLGEAEKFYQKAYSEIRRMPFHTYYGPACFRLGETYAKVGKGNQAEPLLLEAIEHCNYEDSDSGANYKPMVFRSYCALGDIYATRGEKAKAVNFFQQAMSVSHKENKPENIEKAKQRLNQLQVQ
jgi:hypothetical protein